MKKFAMVSQALTEMREADMAIISTLSTAIWKNCVSLHQWTSHAIRNNSGSFQPEIDVKTYGFQIVL